MQRRQHPRGGTRSVVDGVHRQLVVGVEERFDRLALDELHHEQRRDPRWISPIGAHHGGHNHAGGPGQVREQVSLPKHVAVADWCEAGRRHLHDERRVRRCREVSKAGPTAGKWGEQFNRLSEKRADSTAGVVLVEFDRRTHVCEFGILFLV